MAVKTDRERTDNKPTLKRNMGWGRGQTQPSLIALLFTTYIHGTHLAVLCYLEPTLTTITTCHDHDQSQSLDSIKENLLSFGTVWRNLTRMPFRWQSYVTLPYFTGKACYHLALRPPVGPMPIPELTLRLLEPLGVSFSTLTYLVCSHAPVLIRLELRDAPPSILSHLFCGAGHEKRRGEQLKWSLAFRLYFGSFPCAQLPGPVHTARLGRVFYI